MDANSVKTFLELTDKVIDKVPEVYNDGLQPAVKQTGKTLGLLTRAINAALAPLEKWVLYREYSLKEVQAQLELKLKNIEPAKIVAPEPYVAVPTLQAISYCMDCEELRELFANLLAKSMNIDTKDYVHPSFSEIIKQLSPLDANILKLFSEKKAFPVAKYKLTQESSELFFIVQMNIFLDYPDINNFETTSTSITNLERLGLIFIDYDHPSKILDYTKFSKTEYYKYLNDRLGKPPYEEFDTISIEKGTIIYTPLGRRFIDVCINPI